MISPLIVNLIQTKVWDKLIEIDRTEYRQHISRMAKNPKYTIGVYALEIGYFKFNLEDPPSDELLNKALENKIYNVN